MRKTLIIIGTIIPLLAVAGAAFAGSVPPARAALPGIHGERAGAHRGGSSAPRASEDESAYEKAITAYLDNVVEKARQKLPPTPAAPPSSPPPQMAPGGPGVGAMDDGVSRHVLPRVERITIGIKSRAVLEIPDGGRLHVSPGVVTPYGRVTAIRAAGVWFRMLGTHDSVELADVSARGGGLHRGQQGQISTQGPPASIPPPPNFQPAPHP